MKHFLKWAAVIAAGVFGLGIGRLLAAKLLPVIPAVKNMSAKAQEWLFDAIALMTGVAGLVLGTKLSGRFLGKSGGVNVTK